VKKYSLLLEGGVEVLEELELLERGRDAFDLLTDVDLGLVQLLDLQ